jgi:hypothetical protein
MTGEKTLRINGIGLSSTIELVIPEGVKEIKPYTLHFSNVTKIKFPSTLTEIAPYNFIGYTYLTEVTIPSTVSNVGIYAFCGCTALQTVTLNNTGIVYWGAFEDCSALTRVNIGGITGFKTPGYPNTGWHDYPFLGCSNLSTVNTTDLAAFCKIEKLECLTWGDSDYGTARKEPLMINGVAHASTDVLEIPEGVTYISEYAFRFFSNVKKIKLPEGIDTIPKYYFSKHSYLNEITIPSTVNYVGSNAFYNCTNLKRIICAAKTCPSTDSDYNSIAPNPDKFVRDYDYMRACAFLGVVKECNGVWWWWFARDNCGKYYSAACSPKAWADLVEVVKELKAIRPLVTADGAVVTGTAAEGKDRVEWWRKTVDGKAIFIAVNTADHPVSVTVAVPGDAPRKLALRRYEVLTEGFNQLD